MDAPPINPTPQSFRSPDAHAAISIGDVFLVAARGEHLYSQALTCVFDCDHNRTLCCSSGMLAANYIVTLSQLPGESQVGDPGEPLLQRG